MRSPYPIGLAPTRRGKECAFPPLGSGVQAIQPWPYHAGLAQRWVWRVRPNLRFSIRIDTSEACSDFTRVTAHRIAQPPKATFVTRLQPSQLPNQAARQLPDLSTSIRVDPPSTGNSRRQGALPIAVIQPRGRSSSFRSVTDFVAVGQLAVL